MDILSWPLLFSLLALAAALRCYFSIKREYQTEVRVNTKAKALIALTESVEGAVLSRETDDD